MLATEMTPVFDPPQPGKWWSLFFTILMHAVLAAWLFYSVQWQRRPTEPVTVELVRSMPAPVVEPPPPPPPPPPPKPVVEAPPPPQPVVKPDIAIPKPPEKPKKEPPKKETPPPPKEVPPPKAEPAKPAGLSDRERELLNIDRDRANRNAAAQTSQRNAVLQDLKADAVKRAQADWVDIIAAKVRRNIPNLAELLPPDPAHPVATFTIELLPDGSIKDNGVTLIKGTGNPLLDEAAKRAIYKSASPTLPKPVNPDAFDPHLRFEFDFKGK